LFDRKNDSEIHQGSSAGLLVPSNKNAYGMI
jgi:hypothetical protein